MVKKNLVVLIAVILAASATGYFWLGGSNGSGQSALGWPDANVVQGAELYSQYCAACHGENLQGQDSWQIPSDDGVYPAPPHDETGHTWHHDDTLLFDYVKLGGAETLAVQGIDNFNSGMPGFGDNLSDQNIRDILAYIISRWPSNIVSLRAERISAGG